MSIQNTAGYVSKHWNKLNRYFEKLTFPIVETFGIIDVLLYSDSSPIATSVVDIATAETQFGLKGRN